MAVGGIPTLMDVDWRQVKQAKKDKFLSDYIKDLTTKAYDFSPKVEFSKGKVSFTPAETRAMDKLELWNNYVQSAQSRKIKPDAQYFQQQLLPYYTNLSLESFNNQLMNLAQRGVSPKKVQKLYKENPEFRNLLDMSTSNMAADSPYAPIFQGYKSQEQGPGLLGSLMEAPLIYGAGGYGAYKGSRYLYDKAKKLKGGKFAKGLRGVVPAAVGSLVSPLAKQLGATEREAEIAKNIGMTGAGAAYGAQAVKTVARNRLAAGVGAQTKKQLLTSAKKLGIKDIRKNASKQAIQELVENKVKNQSTKATTKALGKSATQKALAKFGAKAIAKQAIGSGLPFWGNVAAAVLTVPDLIQLGRALWGGDDQATPTNEIEVPTNTSY